MLVVILVAHSPVVHILFDTHSGTVPAGLLVETLMTAELVPVVPEFVEHMRPVIYGFDTPE